MGALIVVVSSFNPVLFSNYLRIKTNIFACFSKQLPKYQQQIMQTRNLFTEKKHVLQILSQIKYSKPLQSVQIFEYYVNNAYNKMFSTFICWSVISY